MFIGIPITRSQIKSPEKCKACMCSIHHFTGGKGTYYAPPLIRIEWLLIQLHLPFPFKLVSFTCQLEVRSIAPETETASRSVTLLSGRGTSSSAAQPPMDVMVGDRKVWTAMETRALVTLKEEMKLKFQTMKRNRILWIELSDKMRKHYGHERSPAQCAVRWKNIISAYKDSREALRNPRPDGKVCSFFKEVEAILGDPPLKIPVGEDGRIRSAPPNVPPLHSPKKSERSREPRDANIAALLLELTAKIDAQGAAIARIERMLEKTDMGSTTPAPEVLESSEPLPVPLSENIAGSSAGSGRPYGVRDSDVLLERPSTTSVPDLDVSPEAAPQPNNDTRTVDSARPSLVNPVQNVACIEQITREESAAQPENVVETVEQIVAAEEAAVPVTEVLERSVRQRSTSPSSVPTVAGIQGSDGVVGVGGNVDIELATTGMEKEVCNEVPTAKKRKIAHTCTSS